MTWSMLLPVIAVALIAGIGLWLSRRAGNCRVNLVATTLIMMSAALAVVGIVAITAIGYLLQTPAVGTLVGWCPLLPTHRDVEWFVGIPATIATWWMAARVWAAVKLDRSALREARHLCRVHGRPICMISTDRKFAYAVPGRDGGVVVSSGMLQALSPLERQVLVAHETSHLREHHHGFVLVAALCAAAVPPLEGLAKRVQTATERMADESSVNAVGGDRRLVASAIAHACLPDHGADDGRLSIRGGSVVERVEALVDPPGSGLMPLVAAVVLVLAAWAGSVVQFHHMSGLLSHICG